MSPYVPTALPINISPHFLTIDPDEVRFHHITSPTSGKPAPGKLEKGGGMGSSQGSCPTEVVTPRSSQGSCPVKVILCFFSLSILETWEVVRESVRICQGVLLDRSCQVTTSRGGGSFKSTVSYSTIGKEVLKLESFPPLFFLFLFSRNQPHPVPTGIVIHILPFTHP